MPRVFSRPPSTWLAADISLLPPVQRGDVVRESRPPPGGTFARYVRYPQIRGTSQGERCLGDEL